MIKSKEFSIFVEQLDITPIDVIRYMTSENGDLPELLVDIADSELKGIIKNKIIMGWQIFQANIEEDILEIKDISFETGSEVGLMLKGSEYIAIFACTIDNELNKKLIGYDKEQLTEAYIFDTICTIIVEKSLKYMFQQLQNDLKDTGLKTTNTISPGNCGWSIFDQKKIFQLLPKNYLNISLNNSGMMQPVKSISGIIGIGKSARFKHTDCKSCLSKNCMYRKI